MREYAADKYERLVEQIDDTVLQSYMQHEEAFIMSTTDAAQRTFVDLGAGHGRVLPTLAGIAKNVIAIELNPDMFTGLEKRADTYTNVTAIQGDFNALSALLANQKLERPVFMILQNGLGTVEGDYHLTLKTVKEAGETRHGELVVSLFRQQALSGWGLGMYAKLDEMVGNFDAGASNLEEGIFCTDTGYESKWWSDADIAKLVAETGGHVVAEDTAEQFSLLRIAFKET